MGVTHKNEHSTAIYWWFCLVLSIITALEWAIFEFREALGIGKALLVVSLSVCSIVKFVMVVGWYMHLKDDPKLVKNTFILSLLLMVGVGVGLLLLML